jgi:hypothetical protein
MKKYLEDFYKPEKGNTMRPVDSLCHKKDYSRWKSWMSFWSQPVV